MSNTTTTTSLTAFLLDRIAEDEAAAQAASRYPGGDFAVAALPMPVFEQVARHGPARVLAECAAKRAILDLHRDLERVDHDRSRPDADADGYVLVEGGECLECHHQTWPCKTVRTIGSVYADHPEYEQAWAVS